MTCVRREGWRSPVCRVASATSPSSGRPRCHEGQVIRGNKVRGAPDYVKADGGRLPRHMDAVEVRHHALDHPFVGPVS